MSTKIYNGYKIKSLSILELKNFTDILAEHLMKIFNTEYYLYFKTQAIDLIDEIIIRDYLNQNTSDFFKKVYQNTLTPSEIVSGKTITEEDAMKTFNFDYIGSVLNIAKSIIKSKYELNEIQHKHSPINLQNEIVFFPTKDGILFLVYGNELVKLLDTILSSKTKKHREFRNKYQFQYYGYWNNTDKPKGISNKAWDARRQEWDDILAPDYIPSKHGIYTELISTERFFDEKEMEFFNSDTLKNFWKITVDDSVEIRAKATAILIVKTQYLSGKDVSYSEVEEFNKKYQNHEFDEQIAKYQADFEKLLPVINVDTLKKKLVSFSKTNVS